MEATWGSTRADQKAEGMGICGQEPELWFPREQTGVTG